MMIWPPSVSQATWGIEAQLSLNLAFKVFLGMRSPPGPSWVRRTTHKVFSILGHGLT